MPLPFSIACLRAGAFAEVERCSCITSHEVDVGSSDAPMPSCLTTSHIPNILPLC
jgi:hypothetical protein